MFSPRLKSSFTWRFYLYVPRREAPILELLHKHAPPGDPKGSSLTRQLPSGRLIPNQVNATLTAHPLWATTVRKVHPYRATVIAHPLSGNYHLEGSSLIGLLSVCLCFEEESLHLRIIMQTPISEFLQLILNWATAPRRLIPN